MPTKKPATNEQTAIDTTGMNVWSKLLAVRNEFYAAGAKKTGRNLHAEFMYFELSDIVPIAAPIFAKYNLLLMPTFENGNAEAVIINTEKPDERINFSIPLQFIAEPAKFRMNEVQGVGAALFALYKFQNGSTDFILAHGNNFVHVVGAGLEGEFSRDRKSVV